MGPVAWRPINRPAGLLRRSMASPSTTPHPGPITAGLAITNITSLALARLEFPRQFPQLAGGECGSGDSFVMSEIAMECDVMDMEAYALAKVCLLEGVAFTSVKYVTDGADHASGQDWKTNLKLAADQFLVLYRRFFGD